MRTIGQRPAISHYPETADVLSSADPTLASSGLSGQLPPGFFEFGRRSIYVLEKAGFAGGIPTNAAGLLSLGGLDNPVMVIDRTALKLSGSVDSSLIPGGWSGKCGQGNDPN